MSKHFPILNFEIEDPIEELTKVKIEFPYINVGKIHRIIPSCDCTLAEAKGNKILVEWKPNKIDRKLKEKGITKVKKSISMTVVYGPDDNPQGMHLVVLGFSAIVTSK